MAGCRNTVCAVQMGYNELVSHEDTDPSTQYYLIVLSDGGFMDDATNQITIDTGTVQGQFESFYGTLMPNQTHMNTYYLAIGAEAVALTDRPDLNFACADGVRWPEYDSCNRSVS